MVDIMRTPTYPDSGPKDLDLLIVAPVDDSGDPVLHQGHVWLDVQLLQTPGANPHLRPQKDPHFRHTDNPNKLVAYLPYELEKIAEVCRVDQSFSVHDSAGDKVADLYLVTGDMALSKARGRAGQALPPRVRGFSMRPLDARAEAGVSDRVLSDQRARVRENKDWHERFDEQIRSDMRTRDLSMVEMKMLRDVYAGSDREPGPDELWDRVSESLSTAAAGQGSREGGISL